MYIVHVYACRQCISVCAVTKKCVIMLCLCSIVCPEESSPHAITFWTVMSKVRLEAFMWVCDTCSSYLCNGHSVFCLHTTQGAGTALGELPPYFMARAGTCTYNIFKCMCKLVLSRIPGPITLRNNVFSTCVIGVGTRLNLCFLCTCTCTCIHYIYMYTEFMCMAY